MRLASKKKIKIKKGVGFAFSRNVTFRSTCEVCTKDARGLKKTQLSLFYEYINSTLESNGLLAKSNPSTHTLAVI